MACLARKEVFHRVGHRRGVVRILVGAPVSLPRNGLDPSAAGGVADLFRGPHRRPVRCGRRKGSKQRGNADPLVWGSAMQMFLFLMSQQIILTSLP